MKLEGKTILITGSARRLGKEFALAAALAGANLIIHHAHSPLEAEQTAEEIKKLGRKAWILQADLQDPQKATQLVDLAWKKAPLFAIETNLDLLQIKPALLAPIKNQLGRKRSTDKNAPRTIDLDVIVFNGLVIDHSVWVHPHIELPVSELLPELKNSNEISLAEVARQMLGSNQAFCCVDLGLDDAQYQLFT